MTIKFFPLANNPPGKPYLSLVTQIGQAPYRKTFIESLIKSTRFYGFHGLDLLGVRPRNDPDMINFETL